jgi:hypothetical protein
MQHCTRVFGAVTVQVIGRLAGNHKAGITSLLTLPSKAEFRRSAEQQAAAAAQQQQQAGRGRTPRQSSERGAAHAAAEGPLVFVPSVDLVLAGDSSGGMFLWSPFTTPLGSADREVAPRVSFSGHSGEVWALCLTPGPEDAQVTAPKVFSAGEEGGRRGGGGGGGGRGKGQGRTCVQLCGVPTKPAARTPCAGPSTPAACHAVPPQLAVSDRHSCVCPTACWWCWLLSRSLRQVLTTALWHGMASP